MSQIEVPHYGVHWGPGDVAWLQQARGGTNALGLKASSPFFVRTKRRWSVNHLFGLNAINSARTHVDNFQVVLQRNSLARFLLPLPKDATTEIPQGVAYLPCAHPEWGLERISPLLRMSSPIKLPVLWANLANPRTVLEEIAMTNVQPFVLVGVDVDHMTWVRDIARQAAVSGVRRFLIISKPDVPLQGVARVEMSDLESRNHLDLAVLPWENLGCSVLRAYMRKEWDGSWFTREPIPGNETKERSSYKPPE